MSPHRHLSRGISTADVLAGMALSIMALGGVYSYFVAQQKALAAQEAYAQSQNVTRTLVDLFSREIRMATYDPTGLALLTSPGPSCPGVKQGIVAATPTRVQFRQDLNGDGLLLGSGEDVTYALVGTEVERTDGLGSPTPLVGGVASGGMSFRYFDGSNPPVELLPSGVPPQLTPAQRDCVAKLEITVTASIPNPDPRNPHPLIAQADSQVAIRNRSLATF